MSAHGFRIIAGVFGTRGQAGDGISATSALLSGPRAAAVNASESLFVSDPGNHAIRRVDLRTGDISVVAGELGKPGSAGGRLRHPLGIALGGDQLFIADHGNHAILALDPETRALRAVAGIVGSRGASGDGGQATLAQLSLPTSVAYDPLGPQLFLADCGNHAIRALDFSTGNIVTVAGMLGQRGSSGDGGLAIEGQLNSPTGVAVAAAARQLFIADRDNFAVRRVDLVTGRLETLVGVLGVPGGLGDGALAWRRPVNGGMARDVRLRHPTDVVVDANATSLVVADSANPALHLVNLEPGGNSSARILFARPGRYGPTGDGGPAGLALDEESQILYVAEAYNHVVRAVDLSVRLRPPCATL